MTMISRVSQLWRRRAPSRRHLWAVTTAPTADGVIAHVQIDFTLEPSGDEQDPVELDRIAMDAVEAALRQEVGERPLRLLPVVGDAVDWVASDLVPGATIDQVFVVISDVEMSSELRRRLVTTTTSP